MTRFTIKIQSDNVCPWCYVGKKRLEQGIAQYRKKHPESGDTFEVDWLPYYLNPDAPKQSVDKLNFYNKKLGEDRAKMLFERLRQIGTETGIDFKFGGYTGNTRDSHRLVQLGKTKDPETQTKVIEQLFKAYFENEQDITDHAVLKKAGIDAGLEEGEVASWLGSDQGGNEVDEEVLEAKRQNITGVPHFTICDTFEFSGAQEPAAFVQLFERYKKMNNL